MNFRPLVRTALGPALLLAALSIAQTRPTAPTSVRVDVRTDRPDAIYAVGDEVVFRVALTGAPASGISLDYTVTADGARQITAGQLAWKDSPAVVTLKATEPGILRCAVNLSASGGAKGTGVAGAAVSPEKIAPSLPPPADFDAFWQKQLARLAAEKPVARTTPVESLDPKIEVVDLQITCPGGKPVSAYYAKPIGAKAGTLPAILAPHSAGVRSSDLPHAVHFALMGAICVDVNAHGIPNGRPASFYSDLQNGELRGYPGRNPEDLEGFYFNGMFLRLMRALEFLKQQPEWDGKTLIVAGSSQGGGQALVAAGLDPKVTLVCASVPALCDHTGYLKDRPTGWPHHLGRNSSDKAVEVARYYDAVNFARNVKAESLLTVGLVDRTCPPTTVFTAFNLLPEPKRILIEPAMGHEFPKRLNEAFDEKIREHIAKRKAD